METQQCPNCGSIHPVNTDCSECGYDYYPFDPNWD